MKQQIALITLGISDLNRSKRFYIDGFGWTPLFEDNETILYQMNGFVLGTWLQNALENDMIRYNLARESAFTLAHNILQVEEVQSLLERLKKAGGNILRNADKPPHGGLRGYIADPDGHAWEILWNSVWKVDDRGWVTFTPQTTKET